MRDSASGSKDSAKTREIRRGTLVFRVVVTLLCLMLLGLQYRLWVGDGSLAQVKRLQHVQKQLAKDNKKDQSRNDDLQAQIDHLKSGDEAAEERARHSMGMVMPDETFFLTPTKGSALEKARDHDS